MMIVGNPDQWVLFSNPAQAVIPSVTQPAVPGCRHIVRGIYVFTELGGRYGWQISSYPAAAAQATVTHALAANKNHVLTALCASFTPGTAYVANSSIVSVVDGNTGGTKLLSLDIGSQSIAGGGAPQVLTLNALNLVGGIGTAMTVEFAAAGGAGCIQKVWAQGYMADTTTMHVQVLDSATPIASFAVPDGQVSPSGQFSMNDLCIPGSIGNPITINTDITPSASQYVHLCVVGETRNA